MFEQELKGKTVFFDLDGTLSAQIFDSNTSKGVKKDIEYQKNNNLYLSVRPLKTMQRIVSTLPSSKVFVVSVVQSVYEMEYKQEWLSKNYPSIPKSHFLYVNSKSQKLDVLKQYAEKKNISEDTMVFVEDTVSTIWEVQENSDVQVYHISYFVE